MQYAIVYCSVLEDEIEFFAREQKNVACLVKLPQGLHEDPFRLRREVQRVVDEVEATRPEVEAIVLGYGLCSRGTEGLVARRCRLVLPRAHDCITLLLGSLDRYLDYVKVHPATYWYSPGWNRHHLAPGQERFERLRAQYAKTYGDENADFLMEEEQQWFQTYERATFVDVGVTETAEDEAFTRDCARWLGWNYDRQHGDRRLFRAMVDGEWNEVDFLIVEPGKTPRMTTDHRIVEAADPS